MFNFFLQNDNIYDSICSIKYYLLPVKDQMSIKQMMVMAQRPHELMAGVTPMNLDYFVNVNLILIDLFYGFLILFS